MTYPWLPMAIAAAILLFYAFKWPNLVWGTAAATVLFGIVLAVLSGFEWWIVGKTLVIGTFAGLALELLAGRRAPGTGL